MQKDIFISYRSDGVGSNFASRLANDLKRSGYSVYFNPDETRTGDFPERLRQAITDCHDFICIVTDSYIDRLISNEKICWIRDELLCAKKYDKNIIPLLVNGAVMPKDASALPEELRFFATKQAYVFPDQYIFSPFHFLCQTMESKNDGGSGFRDVYNSNESFDPDRTLEDILASAQKGDLRAMMTAGIYYYYGISGGKNERMAARWFKKVSQAGGEYAAIADTFIARMYYAGSMPREPQSYRSSYQYHVRASKENLYSAGQVGFMQSIGSGCDYDYDRVESYYLPILDQLDNPRKDTLCQFYMDHGEFKKAAALYQEMADTYPRAAYQLGLLYKRGVLSTPYRPDYARAAVYFQKALDDGLSDAAYDLGTLYFNPAGDFKKDFARAQKYYLIAADKGNLNAMYMLGYMFFYGHVEKDLPRSIQYFELAAGQGHVLSASNLALLYQIPEVHNYEKAFRYGKFAAERGDIPSEFVLGTLYLAGRGCEADPDKAWICFQHAAENGSPEAELLLRQMETLGL